MAACPVCRQDLCVFLYKDASRDFYNCPNCDCIFVPPYQQVSVEAEKKRYALHDNTVANTDYVAYLKDIADEIARIPMDNPAILDFGCGEKAVLKGLLKTRGFSCLAYDPLYGLGAEALEGAFDIVVMCEVIEHLRNVQEELIRIRRLCKRKGYVFIRTALYDDTGTFGEWWYKNDPTHINFFARKTMSVVAHQLSGRIVYCHSPSILIKA